MKTQNILRTVSVLAASCCAAVVSPAAESANVQRFEKHIAAPPVAHAGIKREPVTYLGIEVVEAPPVLAAQLKIPEGQGLVVNFIDDDSPASRAGLQRHDVLLKLDDQILIDARQLTVLVRNRKEGDTVALTFMRAGAEVRVKVVLGKREAPVDNFRWINREFNFPLGGQPGSLPLTHESVDRLRDRVERNVELFRGPAPHPAPGVQGVPAIPASPRVMIFRPATNIILSDEAGTLELVTRDDVQTLRATDKSGALIFEGPVSTADERAALPEDLRERMKKLEAIDVMEPPAAGYAPDMAAPFAPAAPGAAGAFFRVEPEPAGLSGRTAPATL